MVHPASTLNKNPTKHLAFKRIKRSTTFPSLCQLYQHLFTIARSWQLDTKFTPRIFIDFGLHTFKKALQLSYLGWVGRNPMLPKVKSRFVFILLHQEFQPFHQEFHVPTQPLRTMFHKSLNGLFFRLNMCNPQKFKPVGHWLSQGT